ncbi:MAG: hypothetical protein ACRDRA_14115 [Pseudonocardiaceae bacterium]
MSTAAVRMERYNGFDTAPARAVDFHAFVDESEPVARDSSGVYLLAAAPICG